MTSSPIAWAVAGMLLTACGALIGLLHKGDWRVSSWIASNYLANYDDEFLKRALGGEILTALVPHPDQGLIDLAGVMVVTLAILATAIHLARSFGRIERRSWNVSEQIAVEIPRRWFWALALCPALFLQFGYDLGRLDQVNLVAFIGSIWLARSPHRWLRMMIAPISITAILMHEAYLLIHLPVVTGILLVEAARAGTGPRVSRERETAIVVLGSLVAVFSVIVWGPADPGTHAHIKESMRAIGFDSLLTAHSTTIWIYSLHDTIAQTFRRYSILKGAVHTALFLTFGAVASWIYVRIVGALHAQNASRHGTTADAGLRGKSGRFLLFSPFFALGLLFIGFDAGRWCAWMAVNQVFVTLYLIEITDDRARATALARMPPHLGAAALVGPLGVTNAFPLLIWIARAIIP